MDKLDVTLQRLSMFCSFLQSIILLFRSNLTFHAFNNLESTQSRRHGKDLVGLPPKQRSKPLKLKYETL